MVIDILWIVVKIVGSLLATICAFRAYLRFINLHPESPLYQVVSSCSDWISESLAKLFPDSRKYDWGSIAGSVLISFFVAIIFYFSEKLQNLELHENMILYHIFKAFSLIVPTRHINNIVSLLFLFLFGRITLLHAKIQKSMFSKVTGQQTHCGSDNFSSSRRISLIVIFPEAKYCIFAHAKSQLILRRLRPGPDDGKVPKWPLKRWKNIKILNFTKMWFYIIYSKL